MSEAQGELQWIRPAWPAPAHVRAGVSLRGGGVSLAPYASLNLGMHVGDDPQAVASNRRRLREALHLPGEPLWLTQVHGTSVVEARSQGAEADAPRADAAFARQVGQVCVVLTADCLPVLFCDRAGARVAAAHAGWRGLAGGVLEATLVAMGGAPQEMMAWLGPAIEPAAFEVGDEVREAFLMRDAGHAIAFERNARGRWQADLHALARGELARFGVKAIFASGHDQGHDQEGRGSGGRASGGMSRFCCHGDEKRFFSYRRDGRTGRMATLIWRER